MRVLTTVAILLAFMLATPVSARQNCEPFPPKERAPPPQEGAAVVVRPPPTEFRPNAGGTVGVPLAFLGDSLMSGAGSPQPGEKVPLATALLMAPEGRAYEVYAIGGQGSTLLVDLFEQVPLADDAVAVIWVGRNNYADGMIVVDDVRRAAEHVKSGKYLVLPVLSGRAFGDPQPREIRTVNEALQAAFPQNYVAIGEDLTCDDWADNVHLNGTGYLRIAATVAAELKRRGW